MHKAAGEKKKTLWNPIITSAASVTLWLKQYSCAKGGHLQSLGDIQNFGKHMKFQGYKQPNGFWQAEKQKIASDS